LSASRSGTLNRAAAKYGLKLGARRFVAGETLDEFVPIARGLNARGFSIASAILGEGVTSESETRGVVAEYRALLDRIAAEGLRANVALKLTHLGLAIDEGLAEQNIRELVEHARLRGNFVRIDMEESWYVDATLRLYRGLRENGFENVGIVLQAYLYRTDADLAALLPLKPNLRLVKGAYLESPSVAYPRKTDVDAAYKRLIDAALGGTLSGAAYCGIATHDEDAIAHTIDFARANGVQSGARFEFQMLYGVRPKLQARLIAEGYPVRVALPFGRSWFPFFMRRLAERPANVAFILGSMFKG
jgi:proline dehydrogenase